MTEGSNFNPAWASPPGATISDLLRERSWDVAEFAGKLGYHIDDAEDLLDGTARIDSELANRLAEELGSTARFWMQRDADYCADLNRLEQTNKDDAWIRGLPTSDMTKWGWISKSAPKKSACLDFFDVSGTAEWNAVYGGISELVAFRKSQTQSTSPLAVIAWLRQGEIVAENIECEPFDRERLQQIVPQLRALTRVQSPIEFLPEVTRLCASAGVAIAIVRAPVRCGVSGAARFITPTKALIQLSFRYRSDDHFWFTLFHEIGHLVLHGREGVFLEGLGLIDTHEEEEANSYSANVLIPLELRPQLASISGDFRKVMRFAKSIGTSPGIVVGQMQHAGLLPRAYFNKLKQRYVWAENS